MEYTAQAASPYADGEVKLTINDSAVTMTALFDTVDIPYAEINSLNLADYIVTIKADSANHTFSKMGNWCQPFYDTLYDAYNSAVLRSLFITGAPLLKATGDYSYTEHGSVTSGASSVYVYENSVVSLPPDLGARRVPLCFVNGMDKGDFELTLRLDTGESYTYSKLGYDSATFADQIEKQIRALREKTMTAVKEIDTALTAVQASRLAKLMPEGAAAPIGLLGDIAPSFVKALENKISETRAVESYKVFKELCGPLRIWAGFRKNEITDVEQDPYLLWLIAPSPDGQFAAVEFAEADAATFVYRTDGDFNAFAGQLNRALEAIDFRREVIRLSDDELRRPVNADYYMAAKRTAALQFVRANFKGRVIHSGVEAWTRKLTDLFV